MRTAVDIEQSCTPKALAITIIFGGRQLPFFIKHLAGDVRIDEHIQQARRTDTTRRPKDVR